MSRSRMYRYTLHNLPVKGNGKLRLESINVTSKKEAKELATTETLLITDFYTGYVVAHRADMGQAGSMIWPRQ